MIERIRRLLDRTVPVVAAALFLVCVFSTGYATINRTLGLGLNSSWVEEVSVYSMIWATVLLMSGLLRSGMHTQFTLLTERLHGRLSAIWKLVIILIEFSIFTILLIGGTQLTVNGGRMFMSAIHITMAWAYLSVPLGAALALLELVMMFVETFTALVGGRKNPSMKGG